MSIVIDAIIKTKYCMQLLRRCTRQNFSCNLSRNLVAIQVVLFAVCNIASNYLYCETSCIKSTFSNDCGDIFKHFRHITLLKIVCNFTHQMFGEKERAIRSGIIITNKASWDNENSCVMCITRIHWVPPFQMKYCKGTHFLLFVESFD